MIQPRTLIRHCETQDAINLSPDGSVIFVEDLERYTVITACGRELQAFESSSRKSGFFTSRLLEILTSPDAQYLTYLSLIHHLGALRHMRDRYT